MTRTIWRLLLLCCVCLSPPANARTTAEFTGFNDVPYSCAEFEPQSCTQGVAQSGGGRTYHYRVHCVVNGHYLDSPVERTSSNSGITYQDYSYCSPEPPEPSCSTDVIPGGPVISGGSVGGGAGVYDVEGCAYTCGINYSKLDGQTSVYDAQECAGLGQEYSTDNPDDYDDPPDQCAVRTSEGDCLDMSAQSGGSCPSGTTYGQVNGTDVCVPSSSSTDGIDPGTAGPVGEGGSTPAEDGSDDGSDGGDSGGGGSDGDGGEDTGDGSDGGSSGGGGGGGSAGGQGDDEEDQEGSYSSNACESPPTCEGDAVQCGIAFEVWKNRCAGVEAGEKAESFFEQKTQGVGKLDDENLDLTDDAGRVDVSEKLGDWADVQNPVVGECPQPREIKLGLGTYHIRYDGFCQLAADLKPLVIFLFTFLGAVSIARTLM